MQLSARGLQQLIMSHVVELRFLRRHEKLGWSDYRRMLCTNDQMLLQSVGGKQILNYIRPTLSLPFNPLNYNLVVAWDLFIQNWRMVTMDNCEIVAVVPTRPPDKFWKYFDDKLYKMSEAEKLRFMNN